MGQAITEYIIGVSLTRFELWKSNID